jgi:hypothetical protein
MSLRNIIKKVLREAVGVPEGIHESSERLMSEIIANLGNLNRINNNNYDMDLTFESPLVIADLKLNKVNVLIQITPKNINIDKPMITSAGALIQTIGKPNIKEKKPFIKLSSDKDTVLIVFSFSITMDMDINNVREWFLDKGNINYLVPSITHELKHIYDNYKKEYESTNTRVDYISYKDLFTIVGGLCQPLRNKFFLMYYLHDIENLVRPSELYSHMVLNKITKEKFLNEFKSTKIYGYLSKGMRYSTETLIDELYDDFYCVNQTLKDNNFPYMNMSADKKIEAYMNVIPSIVATISNDNFIEYIQSFERMEINPYDELMISLGINPKDDETMRYKQARLDEYMRKIKSRADNPDEFFDFIEKVININSEKIFKKVSKIYSLLPSEKENEIHSKINKRVMKETNSINKEAYDKIAEHEKNYKNETIKKIFDEYKKKNPSKK